MLVVINLDISCCLWRVVNKDDGEFMDEGTSLIQWPLLFSDDQSITFNVHYISLTYTALTGAISLTQTIRSVRQGTSPQYQKCYLNLVIWYWYRYLSAQPIISNSEAAMLSMLIKGRHFRSILSNSVNLEGPLLEPARSRQIKYTIEKAFRIYWVTQ